MDVYQLIEVMRKRVGMYIGEEDIRYLRCFLDGYQAAQCETIRKIETLIPLPFWFFHEFVAIKYNYNESTAGWANIILNENNNDPKQSVTVFYDLFDSFKTISIKCCEKAILNQHNIDFHYSSKKDIETYITRCFGDEVNYEGYSNKLILDKIIEV